jgi:hypothetical protein
MNLLPQHGCAALGPVAGLQGGQSAGTVFHTAMWPLELRLHATGAAMFVA